MRTAERAIRRLGLLGLLIVAPACPKKQDAADAGDPPQKVEGTRVGVEIPMPAGWRARVAADQSFQAGPAGMALMRIDREPGAADALPSPRQLRRRLQDALAPWVLSSVHEESTDELSLVSFEVGPPETPPASSGAGADQDPETPRSSERELMEPEPGVLAAKVVGADLYLCASLPGAGPADVEAIAAACRALTVRTAALPTAR